ncbi:hypothetical protein [Patulibacter defluvii]|uniref:hypothetical protein n=1 Tax=Patulibacter defluvii TaxID=3095358 RepID=UPI002A75CD21|nr:hypothetical protein [Patulibacter sp. DM4]
MDDEIRRSRLQVTRRRALSLGTVGLGGLLAACGSDGGAGGGADAASTAATTVETTTGTTATVQPRTTAAAGVAALLDRAPTCTLMPEQTQGPYWFDVDAIRSDVREDRPGTRLDLALRVHDLSACRSGGEAAPIRDAVVEIWHCDAGGRYSGYESGSSGANGGNPPASASPPAGGEGDGGSTGGPARGSYARGDQQAATTDDGSYLRGAQATGGDGIAQFTTIYPGWYTGRTVHIHLKVHLGRRTLLTSQLYFDEQVNRAVLGRAPYDWRGGRDTTNADDGIFDRSAMLAVHRRGAGYLGVINLGVNA